MEPIGFLMFQGCFGDFAKVFLEDFGLQDDWMILDGFCQNLFRGIFGAETTPRDCPWAKGRSNSPAKLCQF